MENLWLILEVHSRYPNFFTPAQTKLIFGRKHLFNDEFLSGAIDLFMVTKSFRLLYWSNIHGLELFPFSGWSFSPPLSIKTTNFKKACHWGQPKWKCWEVLAQTCWVESLENKCFQIVCCNHHVKCHLGHYQWFWGYPKIIDRKCGKKIIVSLCLRYVFFNVLNKSSGWNFVRPTLKRCKEWNGDCFFGCLR